MSTEQAISVAGTTSTEAAPATVEAPVEAPKAEEPPPQKSKEELEFASRFAALTKREKAILQQQRLMQEKAKDLEALSKFEELKKGAKTNPIAILENLGLSYKEITDFVLNDNKPTTDSVLGTLQQQVEALKTQLAEKEASEKRSKDEAAIRNFKYAIQSHVDKNADTFELIRGNNAYDTVFEVASNVFDETGEIPDIDEVAKQVESYLEGELEKLTKLKKIQAKFAPPPAAPEASIPTDTKPSVSKTLTNAAVSAVPGTTKKTLSADESVRKAAAMLKWS